MSNFTTVDIPLSTIVLSSEPMTRSLTKLVNNQGILETYLETLYNTFEINASNKSIGEYLPVNSINSKKYIVFGTDGSGDPDTASGIFIMANLENSTNQGYFRPFDNGGAYGTELKTDKINVSTSIIFGSSATIALPDEVSIDNLTITGNTIYGGSYVESVEYIDVDVEFTTQANNTITLNSNSKKTILLTVIFNQDIYDGTYQVTDTIDVTLIDGGMIEGQVVEIMMHSIEDHLLSTLTANGNIVLNLVTDATFTGGLVPNPTGDVIMADDATFVAYNIYARYKFINGTLVKM